MTTPHCSLHYHYFSIPDLGTFAAEVNLGIFSNDPPFTAPPLTAAQFNTLITGYDTAHNTFKAVGKSKKADFMTAKADLIEGLDTLAVYVDERPGVDETMITLSGFKPTKTFDSHGQTPAQAVIEKLVRGESLQIIGECHIVEGAENYGCIISEGAPLSNVTLLEGALNFQTPLANRVKVVVTKSRKKVINNLVAGVTYWVYFYAANATGVGILSTGQSIMAAQ